MLPDTPEGKGWRRVAANPEIALAMVLLIGLAGVSSLQVVMRCVFNAPLAWTEEISGMVLVWMTVLGAAGLARRNLHARVELLSEVVGDRRWLGWLETVIDVMSLAFLVIIVVSGIDLISQLGHERTPALRIPITYQVAAVPLSAALMATFIALRAGRRWFAHRRDDG